MACTKLKRPLDLDVDLAYMPKTPSPKKKRGQFSGELRSMISSSSPREKTATSPFAKRPKRGLTVDQTSSNDNDEMMLLNKRLRLHSIEDKEVVSFQQSIGSSPAPFQSIGEQVQDKPIDPLASPAESSTAAQERIINCDMDKSLINFHQVELICERLVKQREDQLRELYDSVLSTKLAEHYDMLTSFCLDQIRKDNAAILPSYLS